MAKAIKFKEMVGSTATVRMDLILESKIAPKENSISPAVNQLHVQKRQLKVEEEVKHCSILN